jgi:hypothetical protein
MFTGTTLNASFWRTLAPYSDSSVVQSGGAVALNNAGKLYSANTVSGTVDVTFKFAFTGGGYDSFRIFTRTLGIASNGKAFDKGIACSFRLRSDTGQTSNNIAIENQGAGGVILTQGTFAMVANETYTVRVVDDGAKVSLYVNNTTLPFLTATIGTAYGKLIGFENREGAGNGSFISAGSQIKISAFTVQAVTVVTVEKPVTVNVPYPVPDTTSHLVNMSTLASGTFTTGFVLAGETSKKILIRAVGPTLRTFSVPNAATQTTLTLNSGTLVLGTNSGWAASANASQISGFGGAFPLGANSADSAILVTLNPGNYTAQVISNGAVLLEAYEVP